jgi:hypothetical protein
MRFKLAGILNTEELFNFNFQGRRGPFPYENYLSFLSVHESLSLSLSLYIYIYIYIIFIYFFRRLLQKKSEERNLFSWQRMRQKEDQKYENGTQRQLQMADVYRR